MPRRIWTTALLGLAVLGGVLWMALSAWRQPELGAELARLARPGDIRMLSSRDCIYCDSARHWLQSYRVAFDECLIETDRACAAEFSAQQAAGTPLLMVRGRPQLGFSPQRVLDVLAEPAAAPPAGG